MYSNSKDEQLQCDRTQLEDGLKSLLDLWYRAALNFSGRKNGLPVPSGRVTPPDEDKRTNSCGNRVDDRSDSISGDLRRWRRNLGAGRR